MAQSIPKTVASFKTTLDSQVVTGDTTCTLTSVLDTNDVALASGLYGITIDGDTNAKEFAIGVLSGSVISSIFSVSDQNVATAGFSKYHRPGASVAITDWVALGRIGAVARGDAGFDASAPLYYDAAPTFSSGNQIVTKTYVDSVVAGGTISFNNQILSSQVAGENLTANNHVYFKESDQRWYKVDADLTATYQQLKRGYAVATQTTGGTLQILVSGLMSGFTGLTAGSKYYASNTAGAISTTPGTNTVYAGVAFSTTQLIVDFTVRDIPYGNEKDALAGGSTFGTPSSSNKYVTQAYAATAISKFGGSGSDGALSISSGTTVIDLASAAVVIKNYTSISITGTGALTFLNAAAGGTVIILKSQGDVTLTSSSAPMINAASFGASSGNAVSRSGSPGNTSGASGTDGTRFAWLLTGKSTGNGDAVGTAGAAGVSAFPTAGFVYDFATKYPNIFVGAGGSSGEADIDTGTGTVTSGAGGRGGGGLIIECGGSLNFTTIGGISVAGGNGATAAGLVSGSATDYSAAGGGGGGGGCCYIRYNTLTSAAGTITVSGGTGGSAVSLAGNNSYGGGGGGSGFNAGNAGTLVTSSVKNGGDGGAGYSSVAANTEFA